MSNAIGVCDRCGWKYKLSELKEQIFDQKPTGWLVCRTCMEIDQEQLQVGRLRFDDPKPILNARPENNSDRAFSGWNPVVGEELTITLGTVTVTTS